MNNPTDSNVWEWITNAVMALGFGAVGVGYRILDKRIDGYKKETDAERDANASERRRIWERIDRMIQENASNRLQDYQVLASKDDIRALHQHFDDLMERHDRNMRDLMGLRPNATAANQS